MELVILGSGGFLPQPGKPLPGFAIRYNGNVYLVDAGENTQTRMVEHGISSSKLEAVMISHMHGDHVFGLPGVMDRRSQEGQREDELKIYGPGELEVFLSGLNEAGSLNLNYPWNVCDIELESEFDLGDLKLTVADLNHRIKTFGFALEESSNLRKFLPEKARKLGVPEGPKRRRLQEGEPVTLNSGQTITPEEVTVPPEDGQKFVYITDTRPVYDLPESFYEPDLLVHESMFSIEHQQHAHQKKHSTAREAARVARELKADRLLLTHFSHRYDDPECLLEEAQKTFESVELAREGLRREI